MGQGRRASFNGALCDDQVPRRDEVVQQRRRVRHVLQVRQRHEVVAAAVLVDAYQRVARRSPKVGRSRGGRRCSPKARPLRSSVSSATSKSDTVTALAPSQLSTTIWSAPVPSVTLAALLSVSRTVSAPWPAFTAWVAAAPTPCTVSSPSPASTTVGRFADSNIDLVCAVATADLELLPTAARGQVDDQVVVARPTIHHGRGSRRAIALQIQRERVVALTPAQARGEGIRAPRLAIQECHPRHRRRACRRRRRSQTNPAS